MKAGLDAISPFPTKNVFLFIVGVSDGFVDTFGQVVFKFILAKLLTGSFKPIIDLTRP